MRESRNSARAEAGDTIVIVPIDSIKLWKVNPRKNDKAVKPLQKILKAHGQVTPVVVWRKDNTIRKGNTTWKAMKANGEKEIAVLFKDFKSETEATAYAIADNKSSEFAEWDNDLLVTMLQSDELKDAKPEEFGLTEKEFASLMLSGISVEKLPDVDIKGMQVNVSQVLLLQFDTLEEMEFFKNDVMGIKVKHQKVIQWKDLKDKIDPVFSGSLYKSTPHIGHQVVGAKKCVRKPR